MKQAENCADVCHDRHIADSVSCKTALTAGPVWMKVLGGEKMREELNRKIDKIAKAQEKKIYQKLILIVDCGIGSSVFLTRQAHAALKAAGLWIGSKKMMESLDDISGDHKRIYLTDEKQARAEIGAYPGQVVALLAEGEPGGDTSAVALKHKFDDLNPVMVPGISRISYLSAKTGISAERAKVLDFDHFDTGILPAVRRYRTVFVFTEGRIDLCLKSLLAAGEKDLKTCVVENPGTNEEHILYSNIEDASTRVYPFGSALILTREKHGGIRSFGLDDDEFIRGNIPMTKSEVRAVILSRMALAEDDIVYDIGAGTGSVSVECGLAVPYGHVYSIEKKEEGIRLIRANAEKFGLANISPIHGEAPAALGHLPAPDAAFIGGSSGKMKDLIQTLHSRNPHVRIAATAITLETVMESVGVMEGIGMDPEITELQIAVSQKAGEKHMMIARNPVYLISGVSKDAGGVG